MFVFNPTFCSPRLQVSKAFLSDTFQVLMDCSAKTELHVAFALSDLRGMFLRRAASESGLVIVLVAVIIID